jgi:hypothetical protein
MIKPYNSNKAVMRGYGMLYTIYPAGKQKINLEKYIQMEENENFHLLVDETFFENGKKGLIVSDRRVIEFDKNTHHITDMNRIKSASMVEIDPMQYLYELHLMMVDGSDRDITPKNTANGELEVICFTINAILTR